MMSLLTNTTKCCSVNSQSDCAISVVGIIIYNILLLCKETVKISWKMTSLPADNYNFLNTLIC